ncbi:MAG: GumC family protein [Hyphomicrobiaceae bacterium]
MRPVEPAVPAVMPATGDGQVDLRELLAVLGRRWRSIAGAVLACLALGILYLLVTPPQYVSATDIFIDSRQKKIVGQELTPLGSGGDHAYVDSQVEIIGSASVIRRVVEKEKLASDPEFAGGGRLKRLLVAIGVSSPSKPSDPAVVKQRAMESFARALVVHRAGRTYVIRVAVTSKDPQKAARLATAVAESYLVEQSSSKSDEARRVSVSLGARLDELRARVRQAEQKVQEFRREKGIVTSEGGLVNEQQLTRINTELVQARGAAASAKARFDQVRAALASGGPLGESAEAVGSQTIQRLRSQLAAALQNEASLRAVLLDAHPRLRQIRQEVTAVRRQIEAELKRIAAVAKGEHEIADRRVRTLEAELESLKRVADSTNQSRIRLGELEREAETSRQLLRTFLSRSKETGEQQTLYQPEAHVISKAVAPLSPSKPKPLLVLMLAVGAGLAFGVAHAIAREHLDAAPLRARPDAGPGRPGRVLADPDPGLPTFGSVPVLMPEATAAAGAKGPVASTLTFADAIHAIMSPGSRGAQPFRKSVFRLLHRMSQASTNGQTSVTLLRSFEPGEGASTLALSLGMAAALTGERVLLVDMDGADPALSGVFTPDLNAAKPTPSGRGGPLASIIVEDSTSGLEFLPLATLDPGAMDRAEARRIETEFLKLSSRYDRIIIDGGVFNRRTGSLDPSRWSDLVLLCVQAGRMPAAVAHAARQVQAQNGRNGATAGVIRTFDLAI